VSKNSKNCSDPTPIIAVDRTGEPISETQVDPILAAEIEASRARIRDRLTTLANRLARPSMVVDDVDSGEPDDRDSNIEPLIVAD